MEHSGTNNFQHNAHNVSLLRSTSSDIHHCNCHERTGTNCQGWGV